MKFSNERTATKPFVESEITKVELSAIDVDDSRFRISTGEPTDELRESIRWFGCLAPPIVSDTGSHLVPVAGFKRLEVMRDLYGLGHSVEIRRLSRQTDPLEVLAVAAADARRDREIGPFTVMRALRRALELGVEPESAQAGLLPHLGQKPHGVVFQRHLKLERIPGKLAEIIENQGLSLRRALHFARIDSQSGVLLAEMAVQFRLNARTLEEWSKMIGDVARRDGMTWREVIERGGLSILATQQDRQLDQRVEEATESLWAMRYPDWKEARENARRLVASVDLPDRAAIGWDEDFEAEGFRLAIQVRDIQEFKTDLVFLSTPDRLECMRELLELL